MNRLKQHIFQKIGNIVKQHLKVQIKRFHFDVNPVKPGRLLIHSAVNVNVKPAALSMTNACSSVEIKMSSTSLGPTKLESMDLGLKAHLNVGSNHNEFTVEVPESAKLQQELHHHLWVDIAIPHHYSVQLAGSGNQSIVISRLECDCLDINMEDGSCELHSVKALNTNIKGKTADIKISKPFTGNLTAQVTDGNIVAEKLQGQSFSLTSTVGDVDVSSLYAFNSSIECGCGDVTIGNCHGSVSACIAAGNLNIKSVDGSLTAKIERGNLNIHLTNHTEVSLVTTDGSANISIQDSTPTEIIAQTENFDVDDSIGLKIKSRDTTTSTVEALLGVEDPTHTLTKSIAVKADSVSVDLMDWVTAQQLQFSKDLEDLKS